MLALVIFPPLTFIDILRKGLERILSFVFKTERVQNTSEMDFIRPDKRRNIKRRTDGLSDGRTR